ncbi:MAG TPA: NADPH-dependent FMN reductase [Streptosporangiaceae bacterium]|nr:NADPH-dependent FMN reductase [Streptosporangiaceae bacterium]
MVVPGERPVDGPVDITVGTPRPRTPRPLVVGIGGTGRTGGATERALTVALGAAAEGGARVRLFDGAFLGELPMFRPAATDRATHPLAAELLDVVARSDGLIVASPSYHGGVSAMVKNALDYLEELRDDPRPYLDGRAVGCVVTSAGGQAAGTTLAALRSIVHALRGWPTPLGATVVHAGDPSLAAGGNAGPGAGTSPGAASADAVDRCRMQLCVVGHQVIEFAHTFGAGRPAGPAEQRMLSTGAGAAR